MNLVQSIKIAFKKYFVIGLITIFPFAITIKVLLFFLNYFDEILKITDGHFLYFIPAKYHPEILLGFRLPLLGFVVTVIIILFFGVLSRNYLGKKFIKWFDRRISKIPGLRLVHNLVKQAIHTFSSQNSKQFSRVVLIEFPRKGAYTLAFVTGVAPHEVQKNLKEKLLNVFVPTTPNPTGGYFLMIPEKDVTNLEMTVEAAFKLILTGGAVGTKNDDQTGA